MSKVRPYIETPERKIWLYTHIHQIPFSGGWQATVFMRCKKDLMKSWPVGEYRYESEAQFEADKVMQALIDAGVRHDGVPDDWTG